MPKRSDTLTREQTKTTLLATNGWIMACGYAWDIIVKDIGIGAGVCKMTLAMRK